jgi:signal transduction histidine kinase
LLEVVKNPHKMGSSIEDDPTSGSGVVMANICKMSPGTPIKRRRAAGTASVASPAAPAHAQANLQQLDRLANLGLVSASIAHEMKNGLVAINTFCEVLIEKNEHREMAEMVRRELNRIDGLASQMLSLAAPKPASLAPVNLHELLDRILRLLEHQIHGRLITLQREFQARPPVVRGDECRLQHAVMNLLLNAMEALSQGGELVVTTQTIGNCLRLSIRDTGMGIAPAHLPHIFDAFFTTKKQGTGLGLAICRNVIEEHRGTIEVQSELNRGTTFTVTLPSK